MVQVCVSPTVGILSPPIFLHTWTSLCVAGTSTWWRRSSGRQDSQGLRESGVLNGVEECHHRQTRCKLRNNRRTTEINTARLCHPAQKESQSKIEEERAGREEGRGRNARQTLQEGPTVAQRGFNVISH